MWHSLLLVVINHVAPSTLLVRIVIITYKKKLIEPNTDILC